MPILKYSSDNKTVRVISKQPAYNPRYPDQTRIDTFQATSNNKIEKVKSAGSNIKPQWTLSPSNTQLYLEDSEDALIVKNGGLSTSKAVSEQPVLEQKAEVTKQPEKEDSYPVGFGSPEDETITTNTTKNDADLSVFDQDKPTPDNADNATYTDDAGAVDFSERRNPNENKDE